MHERAVIGSPEDEKNRVHAPATPLLLEYFTKYSVIGDPPVLAGAAHVTASWALPITATTDVGALGTVAVFRMPIVFCGTSTTILEMSLAELVAVQPLDAGFTESICRGSSDSSEICRAGRLVRRRRVRTLPGSEALTNARTAQWGKCAILMNSSFEKGFLSWHPLHQNARRRAWIGATKKAVVNERRLAFTHVGLRCAGASQREAKSPATRLPKTVVAAFVRVDDSHECPDVSNHFAGAHQKQAASGT